MRSTLLIGSVLAGFRVKSLVAEGAMGAVYVAEDAQGGRRVALKLLVPELARDERFRQRFLRESRLAASLDHPHIVSTLTSGEADGLLYLVMDYVEGSDLREVFRREGRLDPSRAVDLVGQVAEALDAAHAAGLVHRDVKPGNILVRAGLEGEGEGEGEQAYVCDFGLARHVSSVSSLTGERDFVGTIDYVSPEQIEGGSIDRRADVYSLGCVLYECLAGTRPFDRESELSVVFAHLNEPPPLISDLRPELPEAFDEVFATALAKSPTDRYSSCGELAAAARAALRAKVVVRRKIRRRRLLLTAGIVLAAAAASGGILGWKGSHGPARTAARLTSISLRPNALNLIDPGTRRVVGSVPVTASEVAFAGGSAWLTPRGDQQRVVRVDPGKRKVVGAVDLPWPVGSRIASGAGSVWVMEDLGARIWRIDARTGKVTRRMTLGEGGFGPGIAYGAGSLWLAHGSEVVRVDVGSGKILHRIPAASWWLLFADGAVWAARSGDGRVSKIDPVENRIAARTKLHGWLSDLAVGGGSVWASVMPDGVVFKLSEDDLGVQSTRPTGPDPERISFGAGHLWIANTSSRSLSSLEEISGARQQFGTPAEPTTAAYHDGIVWAASIAAQSPLPPIAGQELRISTPTDTAVEPDPMAGKGSVEQFQYALCANLLNYPDSAGVDGTRLQPEIAAAMPAVSSDRRTYTFRVQRGFRFSPPSNEPVTARTFQHTLERSLSPKNVWSAGPNLAGDIVGVAAYRAGTASHISGISVRGSALSITLVKPAGDFLTRISALAFCPVPLSVPIHVKGYQMRAIPSAGPYYVSSLGDHRTVLLRNPNYTGSRPRRSERIVYTNDIPTPQAVTLANRGAVDFLPQDFDNTTPLFAPNDVLDQMYGPASPAARAGNQQYFLYQAPLLDYIAFNTRRSLFRDLRLRRAVNYVLDRRALAAVFADTPADQIVPPAVPAFPAGRDYPIDRPDVATARRLAGTRTRRAVLSICGDPRLPKLAQIVKSNLARIKIAVSVIQSEDCPGGYKRADLFFGVLGRGERDPAPFLDQALESGFFGARLGPGPWNDRTFAKRLEQARPLRGQARAEGYRRLDDQLMRAAPVAVFGSFVWSQYFSPKIGCKVFQGEYRFVDIGALCKK